MTFSEGWPNYTRWLNEGESWPEETGRWIGSEFLLPRLPARFDEWGIRTNWKAPVLLRMAADVALAPGEHRVMLRARGLGRLWIDGEVVARTTWKHRKQTNLEPIEPVPEPPAPGGRRHGFAQQEVFGIQEVTEDDAASAQTVRVVLELIVGGPKLRTETSEVCVSTQREPDGPFFVLTPASLTEAIHRTSASESLPPSPGHELAELRLEDASIEPVLARIETSLIEYEDDQRRDAAASLDPFWVQRHELARELALSPLDSVSKDRSGIRDDSKAMTASIDGWIADKIQQAVLDSAAHDAETTEHFHGEVLPILRENCFRCHGDKQQGGLRLDSRKHVLASGDSEIPAVIPGDPDGSELLQRVRSGDMPPTGDGLTADQIGILEDWVARGASWPAPAIPAASIAVVPLVDDASFVRRAYLDVIGVPPSEAEARAFLADASVDKREQLIDRLLDDDRYADHWVSFWMDLLAENPTLLNASLNSTGPFRWFLHDCASRWKIP